MDFFNFKNYYLRLLCVCAIIYSANGCTELEKPRVTEFYTRSNSFVAGEFRWSVGDLPRTLDPALIQTPAELQVVRAISAGLTEWNPKTLEAEPVTAEKWEASRDFRTYTFFLRSDAKWTNGDKITAQDFVRSWRRLAERADQSPHRDLLANIVGIDAVQSSKFKVQSSNETFGDSSIANTNNKQETKNESKIQNPKSKIQNRENWFGVEAVDDSTLRVSLVNSDKDFPKLVAHPAFRPIYYQTDEYEKTENWTEIVTNGAFRLAATNKNELILERSPNYWNANSIKLERVRLIAMSGAENVLAAYRNGEVDAVTNVHFEPLALKLLDSYQDFTRTTYNAVTFYEFRNKKFPFSNPRVRRALAVAIDRERLTTDELDGAGVAANKFLPNSTDNQLKFNVEQARKLLAEAGFPSGRDFPVIKLLVNRNEQQRLLAKAVAAQWRKNLNIETEITISSLDELDDPLATADFDLVRRVVVLPTNDEFVNLQIMFRRDKLILRGSTETNPVFETKVQPSITAVLQTPKLLPSSSEQNKDLINKNSNVESQNSKGNFNEALNETDLVDKSNQNSNLNRNANISIDQSHAQVEIMNEGEAFVDLPAIPLYFSASYALIKPYVKGFDLNLLEAHLLENVYLENIEQ